MALARRPIDAKHHAWDVAVATIDSWTGHWAGPNRGHRARRRRTGRIGQGWSRRFLPVRGAASLTGCSTATARRGLSRHSGRPYRSKRSWIPVGGGKIRGLRPAPCPDPAGVMPARMSRLPAGLSGGCVPAATRGRRRAVARRRRAGGSTRARRAPRRTPRDGTGSACRPAGGRRQVPPPGSSRAGEPARRAAGRHARAPRRMPATPPRW